MAVSLNQSIGHGMMVLDLTGSATETNLGDFANPEGVPLAILDCIIYVTSPGLATCDLHVGVGAAATGVAQNQLFDNFDVGAAADLAYRGVTFAVTQVAMTTPPIWSEALFLTFFTDTAFSTGFTAKVYVNYLRLE